MVQWIEISDAKHPRDQRARTRSAPGANGNVVFTSPANEIGDDQEVPRKSHAADHLKFSP